MKCEITIGSNHEEGVWIYADEKTHLVEEIEELVLGESNEIVCYKDKEILKINPSQAYCFFVEDNKVFALTDKDKLQTKQRLYQIEGILSDDFVKINQSCIANIKKIKKFDASVYGSLLVEFKNGHTDYVSRRQVKTVKERIGF